MCMKNVNTDIVFFNTIEPMSDNNTINLYSVNKEQPKIFANKTDDENVLLIPQINLLLSINATEIVRDGKVFHKTGETKDNTLFFDCDYQVCLRITETDSGSFVDLDTFTIEPSNEHITLCRNIFNRKRIGQYNDILVRCPPKDNTCVLKVLIRRKPCCGENVGKWFVQSVHPIILGIKE